MFKALYNSQQCKKTSNSETTVLSQEWFWKQEVWTLHCFSLQVHCPVSSDTTPQAVYQTKSRRSDVVPHHCGVTLLLVQLIDSRNILHARATPLRNSSEIQTLDNNHELHRYLYYLGNTHDCHRYDEHCYRHTCLQLHTTDTAPWRQCRVRVGLLQFQFNRKWATEPLPGVACEYKT